MRRKRKRWSAERKAALSAKVQAKIAAGWQPFKKSDAIVHIVAKDVPSEEKGGDASCPSDPKMDSQVSNAAQTVQSPSAATSVVVLRIPINNRMVDARDGEGNLFYVYVGNNATFVCGDVIEVRPHSTQGGIWQLVSPIPRDKRRMPKRLREWGAAPKKKKLSLRLVTLTDIEKYEARQRRES
jgi:hypothetical protein